MMAMPTWMTMKTIRTMTVAMMAVMLKLVIMTTEDKTHPMHHKGT